jgi:hypothetical protein
MGGLGLHGMLRGLFALVFVSFVPGWALLDHLSLAEGQARVALAAALSLTICTLAAVTALWLEIWHPLGTFEVLAALSLVGLVTSLGRADVAPGVPSRPRAR